MIPIPLLKESSNQQGKQQKYLMFIAKQIPALHSFECLHGFSLMNLVMCISFKWL